MGKPPRFRKIGTLSVKKAYLHWTDTIFLPLTRAWGGEGYDEAVGGGRVVTRAGRVRIDDWCVKSARRILYITLE